MTGYLYLKVSLSFLALKHLFIAQKVTFGIPCMSVVPSDHGGIENSWLQALATELKICSALIVAPLVVL